MIVTTIMIGFDLHSEVADLMKGQAKGSRKISFNRPN